MFADFGVPPSGRYTSIVIVAGMLPAANAKPAKKPAALVGGGRGLRGVSVDGAQPPMSVCRRTRRGCAWSTGKLGAIGNYVPRVFLSGAPKPSEDRMRTKPGIGATVHPRAGIVKENV